MYASCRDRSDQAYINSMYDREVDDEEYEAQKLEELLLECKQFKGREHLDFFAESCGKIENEILSLLAQTYRPNPNDEAIGKQVYALLTKVFADVVEEYAADSLTWRTYD